MGPGIKKDLVALTASFTSASMARPLLKWNNGSGCVTTIMQG